MSRAPRVGIGTDVHRLIDGRPLWLGTVEIPCTYGLLGHSDGDVLSHASADALLGAAALGEIGLLFPDTDPRCEGISGSAILDRVADLLKDAGWRIANLDATLQAQRPRLAPYREAMIRGIAAALRVEASSVSVKIKSNEGLDAIGRGEGIAAQAIARIEPEMGP